MRVEQVYRQSLQMAHFVANRCHTPFIAASILRFAMSAEVVDDRLQVRYIRASIMVEVVPA